MTRIYAGLYTGSFCGFGYKVWRDREPSWGGHLTKGWRFQVDGELWSPLYGTMHEADLAALRAIARSM